MDILDKLSGQQEILITDFQYLNEWIDKGFVIIVLDMKQGYKYPKYIKSELLINLQEQVKDGQVNGIEGLNEQVYPEIFSQYEVEGLKDSLGNEYGVFVRKNIVTVDVKIADEEGITVAIDGKRPEALAKIEPLVLKVGNDYQLQVYQNGKEIHTEKISLQEYTKPSIVIDLTVDTMGDTDAGSSVVMIGIIMIIVISIVGIFKLRGNKKRQKQTEVKDEASASDHVQVQKQLNREDLSSKPQQEVPREHSRDLEILIGYIQEMIARNKDTVSNLLAYTYKNHDTRAIMSRIERYERDCRDISDDIDRIKNFREDEWANQVSSISNKIYLMKKNLYDLNCDVYSLKEDILQDHTVSPINEIRNMFKEMFQYLTLEIQMVKECLEDIYITQYRELERHMDNAFEQMKLGFKDNVVDCINDINKQVNDSIAAIHHDYEDMKVRMESNNNYKMDDKDKLELEQMWHDTQAKIERMSLRSDEGLRNELIKYIKESPGYQLSPIARQYKIDGRISYELGELIENAECIYQLMQSKEGIRDYSTLCLAYTKVLELLLGNESDLRDKTLGYIIRDCEQNKKGTSWKVFVKEFKSLNLLTLRNRACHKERVTKDEALCMRSFVLKYMEFLIEQKKGIKE